MSRSWGNLERARELRSVVRLDDVREGEGLRRVDAVVMTTHDLNLRFVLSELLPGYLTDPTAVPAGLGPGHRSYRAPMLDLPDVALLHAPEASVDCATPWRPPSLHVAPYRGPRRLHAKLIAVLYVAEAGQRLRLVVSSANLTRRAYAANLEIAAHHDYELSNRRGYPSLVALRSLLSMLAEDSTLSESRAFGVLMSLLPSRRRGELEEDPLLLTHSANPEAFSSAIAEWLDTCPKSAKGFERALIVSPFFPAKGSRLQKYVTERLNIQPKNSIDMVEDGRQTGSETALASGEPFSTPPAWLEHMRNADSATLRPTLISRARGDGAPKGTLAVGRPLHAKLIGTGWSRARAKHPRLVWRLAVGSANFTEGGLGLLGERSNIDAMARVEHEEPADETLRVLARQPTERALCVDFRPEVPPPVRHGPDLAQEIASTAQGKTVLAALDGAEFGIERNDQGSYDLRVRLQSVLPDGVSLSLGHQGPVFTLSTDGTYLATSPSLDPLFISVRVGGRAFSWPIPATYADIRAELIAHAAGRRRVDRLLDYWLASATSSAEPDDEDLEIDLSLGGSTIGQTSDDARIGSWRLNRLALGFRRRLAEAGHGGAPPLPSPSTLLGSIRVRELIDLGTSLGPPDLVYFGTVVRAALLGYAAREKQRENQRQYRISWARAPDLSVQWSDEEYWTEFESRWEQARQGLPPAVVEALDHAAEAIYVSVRDGEVD